MHSFFPVGSTWSKISALCIVFNTSAVGTGSKRAEAFSILRAFSISSVCGDIVCILKKLFLSFLFIAFTACATFPSSFQRPAPTFPIYIMDIGYFTSDFISGLPLKSYALYKTLHFLSKYWLYSSLISSVMVYRNSLLCAHFLIYFLSKNVFPQKKGDTACLCSE